MMVDTPCANMLYPTCFTPNVHDTNDYTRTSLVHFATGKFQAVHRCGRQQQHARPSQPLADNYALTTHKRTT